MEKRKKKRYVTPIAVVKDESPIDNLLELSGPGFGGMADPDEPFDAPKRPFGFDDDWGCDDEVRGSNTGFSDKRLDDDIIWDL